MKNWQFNGLFLALIMAALFTVLQSNRPEANADFNTETAAFAGSNTVGGYVRANYRLDTLGVASDTIGLYSRNSTTLANVTANKYYLNAKYTPLISLYTLDLSITRTTLSGTPVAKVYLEKSSTTTPTAGGWLTVDSTTTTSGVGQISVSEMRGEIYRLRVKNTSGSVAYKIDCLLKKKT